MQPDEAAVYDLCMELSTTHAVSDATYRRAAALFSEQQIVDLLAQRGSTGLLVQRGLRPAPTCSNGSRRSKSISTTGESTFRLAVSREAPFARWFKPAISSPGW